MGQAYPPTSSGMADTSSAVDPLLEYTMNDPHLRALSPVHHLTQPRGSNSMRLPATPTPVHMGQVEQQGVCRCMLPGTPSPSNGQGGDFKKLDTMPRFGTLPFFFNAPWEVFWALYSANTPIASEGFWW